MRRPVCAVCSLGFSLRRARCLKHTRHCETWRVEDTASGWSGLDGLTGLEPISSVELASVVEPLSSVALFSISSPSLLVVPTLPASPIPSAGYSPAVFQVRIRVSGCEGSQDRPRRAWTQGCRLPPKDCREWMSFQSDRLHGDPARRWSHCYR